MMCCLLVERGAHRSRVERNRGTLAMDGRDSLGHGAMLFHRVEHDVYHRLVFERVILPRTPPPGQSPVRASVVFAARRSASFLPAAVSANA